MPRVLSRNSSVALVIDLVTSGKRGDRYRRRNYCAVISIDIRASFPTVFLCVNGYSILTIFLPFLFFNIVNCNVFPSFRVVGGILGLCVRNVSSYVRIAYFRFNSLYGLKITPMTLWYLSFPIFIFKEKIVPLQRNAFVKSWGRHGIEDVSYARIIISMK